KHLKNDTSEVEDADFKPIDGKKLRVFPEDKDIPKDALNGKIDETFVKAAKVTLPEPGKFGEWRKDMLRRLRESSFRFFPEEMPAARMVKRRIDVKGQTIDVERLVTEPGIDIEASPVLAKGEIKYLYVLGEDEIKPGDLKHVVGRENYWYMIPRG